VNRMQRGIVQFKRYTLLAVGLAIWVIAWAIQGAVVNAKQEAAYDPLNAALITLGQLTNREAPVVPQCYTKTAGIPNPCWTCHTRSQAPNYRNDADLQAKYDFSDIGWVNHWTNLFVDRSEQIADISDEEILAYIRTDNYRLLQEALRLRSDYPGYIPDLDLELGFDEQGFALDGSGWRAIRYKPFLATFWPINGNTDDVMVRLPEPFRRDALGSESREIYQINLAILEAAIAADPNTEYAADLERAVEPVDETLAELDLDGNGTMAGTTTLIRGLPSHYVGGAQDVPVKRYLYPKGTEFLHTVRYVDPDNPTLLSTRLKEVRYSRKVMWLDNWGLLRAYEEEKEEKNKGRLPVFTGSPLVGLRNDFGWQLQGFIEDAEGLLRLQTEEEHYFCMGCHSTLGITVDESFAFPRKVPGAAGWTHQDLRGIPDVAQAGHLDPEILTYFKRARGGDAFRANEEIIARFFPLGLLDEATVRRAAPGGDRDITFLIAPSRERALSLNKAYLALVKEQAFAQGRDTLIKPPKNVHESVCEFCHAQGKSTGLSEQGRVFHDGKLWLDWTSLVEGG
jgi:hypothetical protein